LRRRARPRGIVRKRLIHSDDNVQKAEGVNVQKG
jgi:hypothetical protein